MSLSLFIYFFLSLARGFDFLYFLQNREIMFIASFPRSVFNRETKGRFFFSWVEEELIGWFKNNKAGDFNSILYVQESFDCE